MSVLYIAIHTIFEVSKQFYSSPDIKTYRDFILKLNGDAVFSQGIDMPDSGYISTGATGPDASQLLLHLLHKAQDGLCRNDCDDNNNEDKVVGYMNDKQKKDATAISIYFGAISICCCEVAEDWRGNNEKTSRLSESTRKSATDCVKIVEILLSIYNAICRIDRESIIIERTCTVLMGAAVGHGICGREVSAQLKRKKKYRHRNASCNLFFSELSDAESGNESDYSDLSHNGDASTSAVGNSDAPPPVSCLQLRFVQAMVASLPAVVSRALERPDLAVFSARKDAFTLPAPVREDRFFKEMGESLRRSLFALRSQVLEAVCTILGTRAERRVALNIAENYHEEKLTLERYFCVELLQAVEQGVSVRNFKVTATNLSDAFVIVYLFIVQFVWCIIPSLVGNNDRYRN